MICFFELRLQGCYRLGFVVELCLQHVNLFNVGNALGLQAEEGLQPTLDLAPCLSFCSMGNELQPWEEIRMVFEACYKP